jgi:cytidylate kinase
MHFITFSRTLGSQGTVIAKRVAGAMGYAFNDTAAIDRAAGAMGFSSSVEELDGKAPSFFQRYFSHEPEINLDRLNSVVLDMAKQGDAVFVGRGAQVLLKSFHCALHVRVIASMERRIRNLVARGYTEAAAQKAINRSDHERSAFVRFAFGVNWDDPSHYDAVLSTEKLGVDLAVDTILTMARSSEIKACSADAMIELAKLALRSRAEAAIIEAGLSTGKLTAVFVSALDQGVVQLTGVVRDRETRDLAEVVVKNVEGVTAVENRITVIPESVGAV